MTREIRGIHVAGIFGGAFAVIIGVNAVLAIQAVRTFPGLEVKNSYVASQTFDSERVAQQKLGWQASVTLGGGDLRLTIAAPDGPADARIIEARLGRKTFAGEDRKLDFSRSGDAWVADAAGLAPGAWYIWLRANAPNDTAFRQRLDLWVPK